MLGRHGRQEQAGAAQRLAGTDPPPDERMSRESVLISSPSSNQHATPASADGITLRRVATLAEYHECVAIQEETWGVGFRELVPAAVLMVTQKIGGVCAAAFAPSPNGMGGPERTQRMLGFVFGLTGIR